MRSTARYKKDDIEKLRAVLKNSPSHADLPEEVSGRGQCYIKNGRLRQRAPELFESGSQCVQFLKAWVMLFGYGNLAWDVYAFLFHVPFEFVPLYINDETLNHFGLVQWRLDIGK